MKRTTAITAALLLLCAFLTAGTVYADQIPVTPGITQVNDLKDEGMEFRNFRTCLSEYKNPPEPAPSRKGLSTLKESGSSEFSKKGLQEIKKMIPSTHIMIVDLREESHGFLNDRPVSWKGEHNDVNKGKSLEEITKIEEQLLKEAKEQDPSRKTEYTEEALCRELGVDYTRFPVTDMSRPDDATVERFVAIVSEQPADRWMHFHCKAGAGRTTTFMAMYDMMRNARNVSCGDIINRQFLLGGIDLSGKETKGTAWFDVLARERDAFIKIFYEYCKSNRDGFKESWSAWKAKGKH
jgi:protein tyrosine phosphatase (PTP) superfamily phosphohydrolase (DUF442 family)